MIIPGDQNARHVSWDSASNTRGKELVKFEVRKNYIILPPTEASYKARGISGESKPDLLLDETKTQVSKPFNELCEDSSDHTAVLLKVKDSNVKTGRRRISKSMLNNTKIQEEVVERHRRYLPSLIEKIIQANETTASQTFKEITKAITDPCSDLVKRRPKFRSTH